MIQKLPNCFSFILATFVLIFLLPVLSHGQSGEVLMDSLKERLANASTLDSAYTAEEIAKACRMYGDPTGCLDYAQMAYRLAEKLQDSSLLASANNIIGTVHVINNNLEEAYAYLSDAYSIYGRHGDSIWQIKTLNNLALVLWKKNDLDEAKQRFNELIDRIEATNNQNEAEELHVLRLVTYFNLGLMHYEAREHWQALPYLHFADSLLPVLHTRLDSIRKLQLSVRLAQTYLELGEYQPAMSYVQRGYKLELNKGAEDHMLRLMEVEKAYYASKGELEQLMEVNRAYELLKNTYFDVERDKEMLKLDQKFKVELREKEKLMLEKELDRQNLQRLLLTLGVVFFFTVSVILFFSFRSKRKTNLALKKQTDALRQAKLKAEEASNAKDEFLSMMSHEIRTPLNGVLGMTNILLDESPRPRQKENLQILKSSANHLLALINGILDYNQLGTQNLKLEPSNFNLKETMEVLCKALKPEASNKGLSFTWSFDPDLAEFVVGDSVRLSQVINNLVANAIKFTETGGVQVSITRTALGMYRFEVKDTGIGIAPNDHKRIFEKFSRLSPTHHSKYGGTGLGLSISKRLVELMGGTLQLESERGQGSMFCFSLNLTEGRKLASYPKADSNNHKGELDGYTILLAEDNPVNQLVAAKFLTKWGASIVTTVNGEEALKKVKEVSFDAVLMDIQMPVMNGVQATQQIRQLKDEDKAHVPIIALTASVVNKEDDWAVRNGFDGFVYKPFRPEELLREIKALCPVPTRARQTIEEEN